MNEILESTVITYFIPGLIVLLLASTFVMKNFVSTHFLFLDCTQRIETSASCSISDKEAHTVLLFMDMFHPEASLMAGEVFGKMPGKPFFLSIMRFARLVMIYRTKDFS